MYLSNKRQGEIALALIKAQARQKRLRLNKEAMRREIGNLAKETGIPKEELLLFSRGLLQELLDESFS